MNALSSFVQWIECQYFNAFCLCPWRECDVTVTIKWASRLVQEWVLNQFTQVGQRSNLIDLNRSVENESYSIQEESVMYSQEWNCGEAPRCLTSDSLYPVISFCDQETTSIKNLTHVCLLNDLRLIMSSMSTGFPLSFSKCGPAAYDAHHRVSRWQASPRIHHYAGNKENSIALDHTWKIACLHAARRFLTALST